MGNEYLMLLTFDIYSVKLNIMFITIKALGIRDVITST